MRSVRMDIAAYVLFGIAAIVLAFAGLHGFHNKSIAIISFGVGACLVIVSGCLYWQDAVWKHDARPNPTASPASTAATLPPDGPLFSEDVKEVEIIVGGGKLKVTYPVSWLTKDKLTPFVFTAADGSKFAPFKIYMKDGRPMLDFEVFAGSQIPPLTVVEGKISNKPTDWDFNWSKGALEIVNQAQDPIYQIIIESGSRVAIRGVFVVPSGVFVADVKDWKLNPPLPYMFSLPRLFKYPSGLHSQEYETSGAKGSALINDRQVP